MFVCPHCAATRELLPGHAAPEFCPACNARQRPQNADYWTDVARITNLAEAGFLCDELNGLDIDARVFQSDEFSDVRGGWSTTYLIRVPAASSAQAAGFIRGYVTDSSADDEAADPAGARYASESGPIDPTYWRPVVFVMLAGVASFVLGRQSVLPEPHRKANQDSLATVIDKIGEPLYTEASPGRPRFRLTHDGANRVWHLDLDRNGDGRFELSREIESAGAVW